MSEGCSGEAIADLVPYEPGKPVEEVQRELGLERVVKLASNEGPFPPFPAALEAIERAARELNRYPDGGAWALRVGARRAARRRVRGGRRRRRRRRRDRPALAGDARSGRRDRLRLAVVSELRARRGEARRSVDARCRCATTRTTSTRCSPRSGRARSSSTSAIRTTRPAPANGRAELAAFFDRVPEHVLVVLDQAYFEYIDDPDYADGIAEHFKRGPARRRPAHVLEDLRARRPAGRLRRSRRRTSSPRRARCGARSTSRRRRRRPRSRASATTRSSRAAALRTRAGRAQLEAVLRAHGLEPAGPALGNFLFVEVGDGRAALRAAAARRA